MDLSNAETKQERLKAKFPDVPEHGCFLPEHA
jgi:hypothetical protein